MAGRIWTGFIIYRGDLNCGPLDENRHLPLRFSSVPLQSQSAKRPMCYHITRHPYIRFTTHESRKVVP